MQYPRGSGRLSGCGESACPSADGRGILCLSRHGGMRRSAAGAFCAPTFLLKHQKKSRRARWKRKMPALIRPPAEWRCTGVFRIGRAENSAPCRVRRSRCLSMLLRRSSRKCGCGRGGRSEGLCVLAPGVPLPRKEDATSVRRQSRQRLSSRYALPGQSSSTAAVSAQALRSAMGEGWAFRSFTPATAALPQAAAEQHRHASTPLRTRQRAGVLGCTDSEDSRIALFGGAGHALAFFFSTGRGARRRKVRLAPFPPLAKTAPATLLLLFPQKPLRWVSVGALRQKKSGGAFPAPD